MTIFNPNEEIEERMVLEKILEGYKRHEIAEELKITKEEVTNIQKRILRKIQKSEIINLLKENNEI